MIAPKIAVAAGTRPEFIKLVPVIKKLRAIHGKEAIVVYSTGQHRSLMDQAVQSMNIFIDHDFDLMTHNQTPASIQSRIMDACSKAWSQDRPDAVIVQGDTISALGAATAGFLMQIPVIHVEAGLRTYNQQNPWPEEGIRQMIARVTDLHLAQTPISRDNLIAEGIAQECIKIVGNPGIDSFVAAQSQELSGTSLPDGFDINKHFAIITMHRREALTGAMDQFCQTLLDVVKEWPDMQFIWPLHPNPAVQDTVKRHFPEKANRSVFFTEALPYLQMTHLLPKAQYVISDSGGMQEEAPWCGVPIVVTREVTERPEIITLGLGKIAGANGRGTIEAIKDFTTNRISSSAITQWRNLQGNGCASDRIAEYVTEFLSKH